MKRMIVSSFLVLFFASHLAAQRDSRRLEPATPSTMDFSTSLDSSNPLSFFYKPVKSNRLPKPLSPNLIPVTQLHIPSKAWKEFERARKALGSGNIRTSAEHLQKAVQIYPDFLEAHNALGLRFVQTGEYLKAVSEHEIALSLDPGNAQTHQDLSLALLLLNRNQEAEAEARQALSLDPEPMASRYFLARALIGQSRVTPEALQLLHQSEQAFPNASLVLAQIHFTEGRTEQVISDLRRYLQAPPDRDNKQKAECWVAQLSRQSVPTGCSAEITRPSFR